MFFRFFHCITYFLCFILFDLFCDNCCQLWNIFNAHTYIRRRRIGTGAKVWSSTDAFIKVCKKHNFLKKFKKMFVSLSVLPT